MFDESLQRKINWKVGVYITLIVVLDWFWLTGTAIGEIGVWTIAAWAAVVIIQGLACISFLEMATMFKDSAGGLPTYVNHAFKKYGDFPGSIAAWGYILGWGAAPVALLMFAGYFVKETVMPSLNVTIFAVVVLAAIYIINYFGTDIWSKVSTFILVTAAVSLVACIGNWFIPVSSSSSVIGFGYIGENLNFTGFLGTMFIVAWSAYCIEGVLTLVAEYKDPIKDSKKALSVSVIVYLVGTIFVTVTYLKIIPLETILENPYTPLLPLAERFAGHLGEIAVMFAMVTGLMMSVNACFVSSSRVLYQSSIDGNNLKQFGSLNRYNSPYAALLLIFALNFGMIVLLGEEPVSILRAGNVGYFLTVILANVSAYLLRKEMPDAERPYKAPDFFIYLSLVIAGINFLMVTIGGLSWGIVNMLVGLGLLLTYLPLYLYRKKVQDRKESIGVQYKFPEI